MATSTERTNKHEVSAVDDKMEHPVHYPILAADSPEPRDPNAEKLRQEQADVHLAEKLQEACGVAKCEICRLMAWSGEPVLSEFVEVGYGIKKLQIRTVVEDEKENQPQLARRRDNWFGRLCLVGGYCSF